MVIQHGEGIFMKNTEETKKTSARKLQPPKTIAARCKVP